MLTDPLAEGVRATLDVDASTAVTITMSGSLASADGDGVTIAGKLRDEAPMTETPYNEAADRPLAMPAPTAAPAE